MLRHFPYGTFSDFLISTSELASDDRSVLSFSFFVHFSSFGLRKKQRKVVENSVVILSSAVSEPESSTCLRWRKNFEIQYFDFVSFVFLLFFFSVTKRSLKLALCNSLCYVFSYDSRLDTRATFWCRFNSIALVFVLL